MQLSSFFQDGDATGFDSVLKLDVLSSVSTVDRRTFRTLKLNPGRPAETPSNVGSLTLLLHISKTLLGVKLRRTRAHQLT